MNRESDRPQAKNKVERNGVVREFAQRRVPGPRLPHFSPQTDHENTTANHYVFQNTPLKQQNFTLRPPLTFSAKLRTTRSALERNVKPATLTTGGSTT